MLVTVKEAVVVGPTNDFGEIFTVVDNDADRANGVNAHRAQRPRRARRSRAGAPDFGDIDLVGGDFNPERHADRRRQRLLAAVVSPDVNVGARSAMSPASCSYDFGNYEIVRDAGLCRRRSRARS